MNFYTQLNNIAIIKTFKTCWMLNETTVWGCALQKKGVGQRPNEEECNKQHIRPMRKTSAGLLTQFNLCP